MVHNVMYSKMIDVVCIYLRIHILKIECMYIWIIVQSLPIGRQDLLILEWTSSLLTPRVRKILSSDEALLDHVCSKEWHPVLNHSICNLFLKIFWYTRKHFPQKENVFDFGRRRKIFLSSGRCKNSGERTMLHLAEGKCFWFRSLKKNFYFPVVVAKIRVSKQCCT